MRYVLNLWPMVFLLLAVAGCTAADPRTEALRQKFVLAEEPTDAKTIADSRAQVGEQPQVVVVGRISGGEVEPWADGQAAFMIAEARSRGVLRLTLLTDMQNERAQALYRRLGFIDSSMKPMRLKL